MQEFCRVGELSEQLYNLHFFIKLNEVEQKKANNSNEATYIEQWKTPVFVKEGLPLSQ